MKTLKWHEAWEDVAESTLRMKVPGGWVYQMFISRNGAGPATCCFVPDPKRHDVAETGREDERGER